MIFKHGFMLNTISDEVMADNNQKFKVTVKVVHQTETTLKYKPVIKEFDNPYRTSNYSLTKNFNKKDIVRQASKDAFNKKYERIIKCALKNII